VQLQFEPPAGDLRPAFALRVLGPFELVAQPSGELVPVPTAKMRALLAYLAASPRTTKSRRRLAGLLWANRDEERARQSMRQMLSNFRRSPGCDVLLAADEDDIAVNPALVAVDHAALVAASGQTDIAGLSAVAELYRGDFAAGLEIGESEFDAWLDTERARCREAAIAVFDRLVRALADRGRHEDALRHAVRLAEIDPLREESLRLVMMQEAIVSGRASAMRRYEAFRILLREELGIQPEAATLRLLDDLRRGDAGEPAPAVVVAANDQERVKPAPVDSARVKPAHLEPARVAPSRWVRWRAPAIVAALVILFAAAAVPWLAPPVGGPKSYIDEDTGRASIVILPFAAASDDDGVMSRARAYEAEARLAFTRTHRLTAIEPPNSTRMLDAAAVGRALRALYVVKVRLAGEAGARRADASLIYSPTGASVGVATVPLTGTPIRFAGEMYRDIYVQIILHRARTLSAANPDSLAGLLWRGYAAQVRTLVGSADPDAFTLFETILQRDSNQLDALIGLAESLNVRAARNQSPHRAADLDRIASLLLRAREQAPNLAEVAFREGMLSKTRGHYAQAIADFDRTLQLDRTFVNARPQIAHAKMFLGRLEEAYGEMEAVVPDLADVPGAEYGFLAAETALAAGHIERALAYLDVAVTGNVTVARLHALRAAALWLAGRHAEAHDAAMRAQRLVPPMRPEQLARRGGPEADARYQAARDRYVAAFRSALAWSATH